MQLFGTVDERVNTVAVVQYSVTCRMFGCDRQSVGIQRFYSRRAVQKWHHNSFAYSTDF